MEIPLPFSENDESIPADEAVDIERIIEILRETLELHFERCGKYRRDVHFKAHGCARGEFQVLADLPDQLAQGLFARPQTYSCFVRFSNSAPWLQPDALPDGRGLAIQVEDVDGDRIPHEDSSSATQDFIMVNHPTFFARDVKDYLRLEETRHRAKDNPILIAASLSKGAWNPFSWRFRQSFAAARVAFQIPSDPASYTYFSMVPIRFGEHVAKYRVLPSPRRQTSFSAAAALLANRDAMRLLLEHTLSKHELKFEFQVQLRTSKQSMPIEDATVRWPERESPYRTIAHLVLPRQSPSAFLEHGECERRSFNVWHALAAHQPLGGINRVRRLVYPISAACRSQQARR